MSFSSTTTTSAVGRWLSAYSSSGLSNPPMGGPRAHVGVLPSRDSDFPCRIYRTIGLRTEFVPKKDSAFCRDRALTVTVCVVMLFAMPYRLPSPAAVCPSRVSSHQALDRVSSQALAQRRSNATYPTYLSRAGFNLNPLRPTPLIFDLPDDAYLNLHDACITSPTVSAAWLT